MARSADAHTHLFSGGYRGSFAGRPGAVVDETSCYASLMADHQVQEIVGRVEARSGLHVRFGPLEAWPGVGDGCLPIRVDHLAGREHNLR